MIHGAFTTSKARDKHGLGLTEDALRLSQEIGLPYVRRQNKGIQYLLQLHQLEVLVVEEEDTLIAHWQDGATFSFHPGMSIPRMKRWKDGEVEILTTALDVQPGAKLLDCTMGLASDALVASFVAGEEGHVTALESSPLIYAITSYGLRHWPTGSWRIRNAMERIHPQWTSYQSFLPQQEDGSFDAIYFDPMFEKPVYASSGIAPLRREANYDGLTQQWLEEARRVARNRVVVKHRAQTLQQLQFDEIAGGKYSSLAYGILYAR